MKLAIVGATGMVGTVMLEVLKERNFKYDQLLLVASKKSVGKTISYLGKHYSLCLLYTSPSPRDRTRSRMPSSA